ncbi:NYN domain-containing protein [Candidatus Parcubacteria bacterium]|nr:NYN domain-containing protein [Candidatus Parcubacteria bacterium]
MRTYIFIDASNLFYGFDTEYGWEIDYNRLRKYLVEKYFAIEILYFGGIDTAVGIQPNKEYFHDYSGDETVNIKNYVAHFENILTTYEKLSRAQIALIKKFTQQVKFYRKIESFGYKLFLKPVKRFDTQRKANCDVDLTIKAMANI